MGDALVLPGLVVILVVGDGLVVATHSVLDLPEGVVGVTHVVPRLGIIVLELYGLLVAAEGVGQSTKVDKCETLVVPGQLVIGVDGDGLFV